MPCWYDRKEATKAHQARHPQPAFMVTNRSLNPEALHRLLRRALRHGARASWLVRYTPELVELLLPRMGDPLKRRYTTER